MTGNKKREYQQETKSSETQLQQREVLYRLYRETPIPVDELILCLGLYMRSSALSKILFLNEVYSLILDKPGVIMEFGVWWGANLALLESFRSVYEPYNWSRKVVGFDTFGGYDSISAEDGRGNAVVADVLAWEELARWVGGQSL